MNAQVRQESVVSSVPSVSTSASMKSVVSGFRQDLQVMDEIAKAARRQRKQAVPILDQDPEDYDPSWLVALAKENYPESLWLHTALGNCTKYFQPSPHYIFFTNPNPSKSNWQHKRSILLTCLERGVIVVDILFNNIVGGIEFWGI